MITRERAQVLELPERGAPYDPDEAAFMSYGACTQVEPVIFDTNTIRGVTSLRGSVTLNSKRVSKSEVVQMARDVCNSCPVLADCRSFVTKYPEPFGIWAAMLPEERSRT